MLFFQTTQNNSLVEAKFFGPMKKGASFKKLLGKAKYSEAEYSCKSSLLSGYFWLQKWATILSLAAENAYPS